MLFCALSNASFEHIEHLNLMASATKSASSLSGVIFNEERNKGAYVSIETNLISIFSSLTISSNALSDKPAFFIISSRYFFNSSIAYSGEYKSRSWLTNNSLETDAFQKKVKSTFVSTTNTNFLTQTPSFSEPQNGLFAHFGQASPHTQQYLFLSSIEKASAPSTTILQSFLQCIF